METAVSTVVGPTFADQISYGMVFKMVEEQLFLSEMHQDEKSVVAAELKARDEVRSYIAKFMAKTIRRGKDTSSASGRRNPN